jgi:pimeloyl-ACP methyl ester carboxylesterase
MPHSQPVDGFRLAYSDSRQTSTETTAVVLLHGWPGDATDYRHVVPLLTPDHRVVVPDLRASVTPIATSAATRPLLQPAGAGRERRRPH